MTYSGHGAASSDAAGPGKVTWYPFMIRVLTTLLSHPPRKNAAVVAAFSIFLLTCGAALAWSNWQFAATWMPGSRDAVFEAKEYWRLFTTLFVHADAGHLVSNAALYGILAFLLYGYFGVRVFPVLSWALAVPMTAIALTTYSGSVKLIGASGLVHLMGGMWLSLYFCLARNKSVSARLIRSLGVMLAIFFPTSFEAHISYRVHFIGLGIGLVAGLIYYATHRAQLRKYERVIFEEDHESPIEFNNLDELELLDPP